MKKDKTTLDDLSAESQRIVRRAFRLTGCADLYNGDLAQMLRVIFDDYSDCKRRLAKITKICE